MHDLRCKQIRSHMQSGNQRWASMRASREGQISGSSTDRQLPAPPTAPQYCTHPPLPWRPRCPQKFNFSPHTAHTAAQPRHHNTAPTHHFLGAQGAHKKINLHPDTRPSWPQIKMDDAALGTENMAYSGKRNGMGRERMGGWGCG